MTASHHLHRGRFGSQSIHAPAEAAEGFLLGQDDASLRATAYVKHAVSATCLKRGDYATHDRSRYDFADPHRRRSGL